MARIAFDDSGGDTGHVNFFNDAGSGGSQTGSGGGYTAPNPPPYIGSYPSGTSFPTSPGPVYQTNRRGPYDDPNPAPPVIGAPDQRTGPTPVVTGGIPRQGASSSIFGQGSTAQDLINYLNSNHLDPTGAQSIVQQYAQSQGLTGNQGNPNGMDWGAYDASRQKYYVPGYDVRYENGQWVPHAWGAGGSDSGSGGGVFSDPATAPFEQLLNQLIGKLNTPYTPPDFQPAVDYLKQYFQQLQQPVYTDQQRGVIQGQALDPLNQQRDATRQQIIQHFAQQGITPDSGIVQKALQTSDQQFEQLRTQAQSSFANNEIAQGKQQAAQAAQLGPAIAQLEQGQFGTNEQRALQSANLASIIPQLAWSRITGANNLMQQTNPLSALGLLNQFQTQGYNQGADYGNSLSQLFAALAPLFY